MTVRVFLLLLAFLVAVPARAETLAVTHARAFTMTGEGIVEDATIVIRDGRIAAVGPDAEVPAGARVIDAGGRIVTPGLVNPATQLGLIEVGSVADSVDTGAGQTGLGAAFDVQYALDHNSALIPLARADGLTRAVVFPEASAEQPFLGLGAAIRLDGEPDLLDRPGLALFVRIGGANTGEAGKSRAADWIRLRRALGRAAEAEGPEAAEPDIAPLVPVVDGERPLAVFTQRESDIRQAVAVADEFGLDLVLVGAAEAWRAAALLAEKGVPVVLDPGASLPMSFDEWGARADNAARLAAAGVPVAFYVSGVDMNYNAGLALRQAAGLAWANGMSRDQALAAITSGAARAWGMDDRYGTLAPGREADVVIWDGDPLEPMSAPVRVLIRGVETSLRTRQKDLAERYHPGRDR